MQYGGIIMKITDAIKDFLIDAEIKRFSKSTRDNYRRSTRKFALYLREEQNITMIEDVNAAIIKQYTAYLINKGLKGTTINSYLKIIKVFLQHCYNEDFNSFNPKRAGFKWVKEEKPIIRAFTVQDVRSMLANCGGTKYIDVRDKTMLTIMVETGIRAFEICGIKLEDIKEEYIVIRGKGQKLRSVPITPIMRREMLRYERIKEDYFLERPHEKDYYFLSHRGRQLDNIAMTRNVKKRGSHITGVRVSSHTLRHFFAQQSIKNGMSLYSLSRLLGHENVGITQIYLNSLQDADIVNMNKNNSVLMNM
jgi:integrase/recombinase XerD